MLDWLKFFYDLAMNFFKAFAYAVQEYPLPTVVVFICAYFLYEKRRKEKNDKHDILFALITFVGAVIVANVVGWIFHALLAILQTLFGWTTTFSGPFSKNPIAFLLTLIAAVVVGYIFSWLRYKVFVRKLPIFVHACIFFVALFAAYVITNVYVQVAGLGGDKTRANSAPVGIEGNKK